MNIFLRILKFALPYKSTVIIAFVSSILYGLFNATSLWVVGSLIGTIMGVKENNLSEMIINSCPNLVESLCGKELFLQRRAHTVVNVPGAGQAKQWPHYEMMSGISPHTYIIWAPLHDLEDQGGVYYIDQHTSLEIMKKEEESGLVNGPTVLNMMHDQKPTQLKFGQAIIFNPFILHGNISFNSDLARIACNVRFQSCHRPLLQKNSDYLKYYELP